MTLEEITQMAVRMWKNNNAFCVERPPSAVYAQAINAAANQAPAPATQYEYNAALRGAVDAQRAQLMEAFKRTQYRVPGLPLPHDYEPAAVPPGVLRVAKPAWAEVAVAGFGPPETTPAPAPLPTAATAPALPSRALAFTTQTIGLRLP